MALVDDVVVQKVMPAFKQLEMFEEYKVKLAGVVGPEKASSIISEALYFVSAGSNDFIISYFVNPALQNRYTPAEFNSVVMSAQTDFIKVYVNPLLNSNNKMLRDYLSNKTGME